ncbi:MAG: GH3 family domain-containing protein [Candidatus Nanoarchaeia archaeon]
MSLTNRLWQVATGSIYRKPDFIQKQLLDSILRENSNSEYGKKYEFSNIRTINEFQKNVPIINYDDIHEHIEKIKTGKQNVLTSNEVIFFATTSGTTNIPKFIPVTEKRFEDVIYGQMLWTLNAATYKPKLLGGKILYFTGAKSEGLTSGNIPYGSISGYLANRLKKTFKNRIAVSNRVYECKSFEEKMEIYLKEAEPSDVRNISFAYPIELKLFAEYISEKKGKIINLKTMWPNLSVIGCCKKSLEDYSIDELIDDKVMIMDHGIHASEGIISIGFNPNHRSGIPAIQQTFLEFRELENTNEVLLVNQLEIGKSYEVIMTTPYGLYRYQIGDIVKVTARKHNLPLIEFESRNKTLDVVGEHCPYSEIEQAVLEAKKQSNFQFADYVIIPSNAKTGKPFYEIFIEQSEHNIEHISFLNTFDNLLQENVLSYNRMRTYFSRLDAPELTILKEGTFNSINKLRVMTESTPKAKHIRTDAAFREQIADKIMLE